MGSVNLTTERSEGVATEGSIVYLVTIKNNTDKYTPVNELEEKYNWLVKRIKGADWHSNYALELDKQQRLHIHAVFTRVGKVNPASYRQKGWTIHFQPFNNYQRAIGYCFKYPQNQYVKEQRDCESYYHHHYGFINS